MTRFRKALTLLRKHEGGFGEDHEDPGGATKYGISLRWLRSIRPSADAAMIAALTETEAEALYREAWWPPYLDAIAEDFVAIILFDLSVNMGSAQAVKLLQRAAGIPADGVFGPRTLDRVNALCGSDEYEELIWAWRGEVDEFYRSLNKPRFFRGWMNRLRSMTDRGN